RPRSPARTRRRRSPLRTRARRPHQSDADDPLRVWSWMCLSSWGSDNVPNPRRKYPDRPADPASAVRPYAATTARVRGSRTVRRVPGSPDTLHALGSGFEGRVPFPGRGRSARGTGSAGQAIGGALGWSADGGRIRLSIVTGAGEASKCSSPPVNVTGVGETGTASRLRTRQS